MTARKVLVILMLLWLPGWAIAGELESGQIERFIISMKELQSSDRYLEAVEAAYRADNRALMHPGSLPVSAVVALLTDDTRQHTLEPVIREHGFSGLEAWTRTGDRILVAVLSEEMGSAAPGVLREIGALKQQTRQNDHFSGQQKARMQAMLEDSARLMERVMAVDDADREAVKPWLEDLKEVLSYGR